MGKTKRGKAGRYCNALRDALLLGLGLASVLWSAQAFATEAGLAAVSGGKKAAVVAPAPKKPPVVGLAAVFGGRAVLTINGAAPRTLAVGQSYNGVKLLAVQSDGVQVEIDGKRRSLRIGQNAVGASPSNENASAVLVADAQGHFQTVGSINGRPIRFLVDTGASLIGLSLADAKRLELDLSRAKPGVSTTANGTMKVYRLTLNTVKVGDITLHNVEASVGAMDMPFALLGMSFLNRMKMERNGSTMTLIQQFR
jgi:aspartyl protease family protein